MLSNSGSTSSRPRPPPPPPPSLHFEYVHYGVESLQDTLSDLLPAHLHLPLSLLLIIVLIGSLCTIAACRACYFIERNNTLMKRSTSRLDIDAMNENEGDEAFETMESGGTGNGNNVKAPLLSASSRRSDSNGNSPKLSRSSSSPTRSSPPRNGSALEVSVAPGRLRRGLETRETHYSPSLIG